MPRSGWNRCPGGAGISGQVGAEYATCNISPTTSSSARFSTTFAHATSAYELIDHWKQGEFHHDVVVRLPQNVVLVVATNCNGGVKEVLAFETVPDCWALWHWRCPHVADFSGDLPPILGRAVTPHWFDPCDLLRPDARSDSRGVPRAATGRRLADDRSAGRVRPGAQAVSPRGGHPPHLLDSPPHFPPTLSETRSNGWNAQVTPRLGFSAVS